LNKGEDNYRKLGEGVYRHIHMALHDLKAYKGDIIQHTIPLKEGAKVFRQKLRKINPKLAPLTKKSSKRC
jgi:hypothetical protein